MPYGLTVDGSAERARYAQHVQGYLAATLLPLFAAWEGELPAHLQKARFGLSCMPYVLTLVASGRFVQGPVQGWF